MEKLFLITLIILMIQLLFVIWNVRQMPKLEKTNNFKESDRSPLISILIPARNEERNIGECLASLVQSNYKNLQILVLDDRSEDRTPEIVKSFASQDERIKLIEGSPLPSGWAGKVFACHQLSRHAAGEWWLFMDADARVAPDGITSTLQLAKKQGRGLITGFPYQEVRTFFEKLIVPLMTFTIACHLPVRLVRKSRDPKFVAAHGAFMFINRESYRVSGGHSAIKDQIVDDMALARRMKEVGEPVTLAYVHTSISMRMYHNSKEVWNGFRKNIYAGLGRRISLLLPILITYFMLYVLPSLLLLVFLLDWIISPNSPVATSEMFFWATACMLLGMGVKFAADRNSGQPGWLSICMPLSTMLLILLALDSCRGAYSSKGYQWKGRKYT
ncbi:glycosyltransferase [Paenibacillus sp. EC2-1]|uniref:glycosyltransferase n=1 Tax=Paenibacillus sp. EC2-1 TaxID=3388665 RepID=UPI003BEF157D